MSVEVRAVSAWEAIDSRGHPTVACRVVVGDNIAASAKVPSGSTSAPGEAAERRDGGRRFGGYGVRGAVNSINAELGPALVGSDATDQTALDVLIETVDGTEDLSRLGANATMAVSVAVAKAVAASRGVPTYEWISPPSEPRLPVPLVNLMFGDAHRHELQHLMCVPRRPTFSESLEVAWDVRAGLTKVFVERDLSPLVVANSNAGAGAVVGSANAALELTMRAVEVAGLAPGVDVDLAFDLAAYRYWEKDRYRLPFTGAELTPEELLTLLLSWIERFPIAAIEDPFRSEDMSWWRELSRSVPDGTLVVSDRLSATSAERLGAVAGEGAANAVLVKPNQAGTVTRTRAFVDAARSFGLHAVMGSRAGSTEDGWSADMCLAWDLGFLKAGAMSGSDRTAKWNRVLEAEAHGVRPTRHWSSWRRE